MKIKTLLTIAALAASHAMSGEYGKRITIHGEWNPYDNTHLMNGADLRVDRSYVIENRTDVTIYVMLVEGRIPREYFPMQPGETRQFGAPWNLAGDEYSLDFSLWGLEESTKLNGRNGIHITEAPEFAN